MKTKIENDFRSFLSHTCKTFGFEKEEEEERRIEETKTIINRIDFNIRPRIRRQVYV